MGRIKGVTKEGEDVTSGPSHGRQAWRPKGKEWGGLDSCQREQEGAGPRFMARATRQSEREQLVTAPLGTLALGAVHRSQGCRSAEEARHWRQLGHRQGLC